MSEAIQDARRWLAAFDSLPADDPMHPASGVAATGARHVRALLQEMALMGRRPAEAGYDWLMTNVDAQVAQATEARNQHRHYDEDIHLRVASVRSNQAVAAAIWDGATATRRSEWDTLTAKEADAFQSVAMAVLNASPGTLQSMPGYPDATAHEIIEACHLEGIDPEGVELICSALVEAGPWEEIDGDGTNISLICEHIEQLGRIAFAASCKHGPVLVDGIIDKISPATDGDGIRLLIVGKLLRGVDIVDTMSVMIHERPRSDAPVAPPT